MIEGCIKSINEYNLPHTKFDSNQIKQRYPLFKVPQDFIGIFEENGGTLFPEKCIETFIKLGS